MSELDSPLIELKEKFEPSNCCFFKGGYLRYSVNQTIVQVKTSKTSHANIFEEFILHSALNLSPSPSVIEISEMLGIDPMFTRKTIQSLQEHKNLEIGISDTSEIKVTPITQDLFTQNNSVLKPNVTEHIYAIEDYLAGHSYLVKNPLKNAPFSLKSIDSLIDEQKQTSDQSCLNIESIENFFGKKENIFITQYQEIESRKVDKTLGLLVFQDSNDNHIVKAFLDSQEVPEIADKIIKLKMQGKFSWELLSPAIPVETAKSIREIRRGRPLIKSNNRFIEDPIRVYINIPEHLANVIFWVALPFRTNPLSAIPGGYDVIVEYHSGRALGYNWVKYPWSYIEKFFDGIIEYGLNDFKSLDEENQFRIVTNKITRFYASKHYRNEEERTKVNYIEVWNFETSNEMPWESLEKFARKQENHHKFNFNENRNFSYLSLLDHYGYEPDEESPMDKAERLYGVPDPRLVED
jgi:hypothetical protein